MRVGGRTRRRAASSVLPRASAATVQPRGRLSASGIVGLCRDRRLVTPEIHATNDYYGHAALLKRYASLPPRRPLKTVVEHGPFMDDFLWEQDLRSPFSIILCASERRAEWY